MPARATAMAINRLSREVLQIILGDVFNDSPQHARIVRLVCRAWDAWLRPLVFRTLRVIFSRRRNALNTAMFQHFRTKDTATSSLIHCVEISDWYDSGLCPSTYVDLQQPFDWLHTGLLSSKAGMAEATNQPIVEGGGLEQVKEFCEFLAVLSLHQFR
jgi:hypothetical protein